MCVAIFILIFCSAGWYLGTLAERSSSAFCICIGIGCVLFRFFKFYFAICCCSFDRPKIPFNFCCYDKESSGQSNSIFLDSSFGGRWLLSKKRWNDIGHAKEIIWLLSFYVISSLHLVSSIYHIYCIYALFFCFLNFLFCTAGFSKLIWLIRSAFATFPQLCSRFTALNPWYHLL